MAPGKITLMCWIFGEPISKVFAVEIERNKYVAHLRKAIKAGNDYAFQQVSTKDIAIWKVSIPLNEQNLHEINLGGHEELSGADALSTHFPDAPVRGYLHIVARPEIPETLKRPHPPSSSPPSNEAKRLRTAYYTAFVSRAPSDQAVPSEFDKYQDKPHGPLAYCNRPFSASSIPVTLLHPVFGVFVDESRRYIPTKEDNAFVLELSMAMSDIFPIERDRRAKSIDILREHYGIQLMVANIGHAGITDGHRLSAGHMSAITVAKSELNGSGGAEPTFKDPCNTSHQ